MLPDPSPEHPADKHSHQMLTDSHNLVRAVANGTADVIYVKDLEGRYLMINTVGANLFKLSVKEVLYKRDSELPSTEASRFLLRAGDGDPLSKDSDLTEEEIVIDGKPCTFVSTRFSYFDAEGKAIGTIGIARDVSELKQLGDALRQSQKMEAIGRLAGGIAHDFNNLLTVIINYSELLMMTLPEGDPKRHQVNEIFASGQRAAGLTRQLIAFSRKQTLQPQIVGLRKSLDELAGLLRPTIGRDIELSIDVAEDVADVKIDLVQFQQLITNLALNARDAMPHGGRMSIAVANFVVLPQNLAPPHPHLKPGRYAQVTFEDTGTGMSNSLKNRIFEPFITAKPIGNGTDLALSMAYGFLTQTGGHIEVSSSSGFGSGFRLYLPCAPLELPRADLFSKVDEFASLSLGSPRGNETVLLVEDEEAVRVLCCRILEACGYSVLQAKDGVEALELLRSAAPHVDLLLTDVIMPRMDGPKLLAAIWQELPHLPVLFISGYADEVFLLEIPADNRNLLRKPFKPKQLAQRVRETLNATAKMGGVG